jgi:hypothetical protein
MGKSKVKKCEYFKMLKEYDPPSEPGGDCEEFITDNCLKKTGWQECYCGGDLEVCDFDMDKLVQDVPN